MAETLVTLNIEGDRHFHRFLPKLKAVKPSIICFQELFQTDRDYIAAELGMKNIHYVPTMRVEKENKYGINPRGQWGIGLMSTLRVIQVESFYYGPFSELKVFEEPNDSLPAVIIAVLSDGNQEYRVATTHFTWSPGGEISDRQTEDFARLTSILDRYLDLVLCGDFNAPRGREMFKLFEQRFTDHLPPEIITTLDNDVHYAGHKNLQLVVDTIFSTPKYRVLDVEVLSGVSDHLGVKGTIERVG